MGPAAIFRMALGRQAAERVGNAPCGSTLSVEGARMTGVASFSLTKMRASMYQSPLRPLRVPWRKGGLQAADSGARPQSRAISPPTSTSLFLLLLP
jgi:hypothetical protein